MGGFDRLFHPRGVAIVGASPDVTRGGGQPVHALLAHGYTGRVYPVNPKYDAIGGVRCYRTLREIDGPCDLAVIALSAAAVIDAVRDCAERGIHFAVIYGGGFREAGAEGRACEAKLLETARAGGVRFIGPNCLGLVNMTDRVYAAFGSMTRPPLLPAGHVSMVYQSGGFGQTLALRCAAAGAGLRYLVASGNETDITALELIAHYLDDPETHIVVSYIEGVNDGRALMELGRKAAALGKPLLLWKGGRGEQGLKAAASHTASMTGRYDIYRAALRQAGIIELRDIDELGDLVQIFGVGRLPRGPRVAVMGGSGGSAIVFADAADEVGLKLPPLAAGTIERIRPLAPGVVSASNPFDFAAGFLNDANARNFAAAVDLVLADENIEQLAVMLATVQGKQALNGARALAAAAARTEKPIYVFSSMQADTTGRAFDVLAHAGIPVLPSPTRVARAAAVAAAYARAQERVAQLPAFESTGRPGIQTERRTLWDEAEAKTLLRSYGIPVTQDTMVELPLRALPRGITYPCVVKVLSRDLPHKTDAGGVALGLPDAGALEEAIPRIVAAVSSRVPGVKLSRVLVSEMVSDATEVIVGAINDEVFGPVVLLGLGGTLAEVMRDVTYRVAPFGVETARSMIAELRGSALFDGVRGQAPRDVEALAEVVSRVSALAWERRGRLVELDINPLFVRARGAGVVVADALATVTES
ncbi:MAG: hypothetical protein A3G24_20185 [Betaproteobacteria bacterium RIFCSPLOWO2_12_FULL_62_13]|nr:MAG: hypothetical protein A3G24_20185 [Betaproteobacteria bacterium RIFCSPLOWO2_12_FULL_62_13]